MVTPSNILAWEIPWTEEPDGLQSMGLQKSWTQLKQVSIHATTIWQLDGGGGGLVVKLYLSCVTL